MFQAQIIPPNSLSLFASLFLRYPIEVIYPIRGINFNTDRQTATPRKTKLTSLHRRDQHLLKITLNTALALLSPSLSLSFSSHRLARTFNTAHYSHRETYQLKISTLLFPIPLPFRVRFPLGNISLGAKFYGTAARHETLWVQPRG